MDFRALKNNHYLSRTWTPACGVDRLALPYNHTLDAEPRTRAVWALFWVLWRWG